MNKKVQKTIKLTLSYIFIIGMLIMILYPVIFTVVYSLQPGDAAYVNSFSLENATFENYKRLFTSETLFKSWYIRTLVVAILATALQLIVVTFSAYIYSRFRFNGRKNSLITLLLIQMVPNTVALPIFYIIAITLHMQNFFFLVLIYVAGAIPMNTLLMKGYFDTIPRELDKSAMIEGASSFYIYRKIILPLAKPMIVVMALWAFMAPFMDYMTPMFLFAGNPSKYTIAAGLQTFVIDASNARNIMFASGSILISIPVIALFYYLQKELVSGLLKGSTKG